MSEERKVTEEELTKIKALQEAYLKVTYDLGQLAVERLDLEAKLNKVGDQYNDAAKHLEALRNQEQELSNTLQENYGSTTIDLETGVIS
jgi:uncharacterized protein (DUF3084 family)